MLTDAPSLVEHADMFKQVCRAHKVLIDPQRRQAYNDAISLLWQASLARRAAVRVMGRASP